tara:strand:- start:2005 stop:4596 length:2592 start_codon:yes stop_codon:yes gene_type:complete
VRIKLDHSQTNKGILVNQSGLRSFPSYLREFLDLRTIIAIIALSLGILVALAYGPDSISTQLRKAAREIVITSRIELDQYFNPNQLPTVYIDMNFESYQRIVEKRTEAIKVGQLYATDDDFVPAQIRYMDQPPVKVRMRLKGDMSDHWAGDKWSYRVHVLDGREVAGLRRFSIQDPMTRQLINEWLIHQMMFAEDILTTRYAFINVVFNGQYKGTYAIEESFSGELLEAQRRTPGVIFKYENQQPIMYRSNTVANDPVLSSQATTAANMLQSGHVTKVYDNDRMGRLLALLMLWDANHGVGDQNRRYYFNPINAQIEPISYDASPVLYPDNTEIVLPELQSMHPLVAIAYIREMIKVSDEDYLNTFKTDVSNQLETFLTALRREYLSLEAPWTQLSSRQASLRRTLNTKILVVAMADIRSEPHSHLLLEISNLGRNNTLLSGLILNNSPIDIQQHWILPNQTQDQGLQSGAIILPPASRDANVLNSPYISNRDALTLSIPIDTLVPTEQTILKEYSLQLLVSNTKLTEEITVPVYIHDKQSVSPIPSDNSILDLVSKHPFISIDKQKETLYISAGIWDVMGDLVLPQSMKTVILPGTTLRFDIDAVLVARNSLDILGTDELPVVLTAKQQTWGGVSVIEALHESSWKHVLIEKTEGVNRAGWTLTGGITFYESPSVLDHVKIAETVAEDALNIVRSSYKITNSEFRSTVSDAFDGDFSAGTISTSHFHDIGGDAIDVSGANLSVTSNSISKVVDKAISAGENSSVEIDNTKIENVGIGIASKDSSTVSISNSIISKANNAALAAFIKKPEYGPATIRTNQLTISDTELNSLVQTNSTVLLNGIMQNTSTIDVDDLYAQGILGN